MFCYPIIGPTWVSISIQNCIFMITKLEWNGDTIAGKYKKNGLKPV